MNLHFDILSERVTNWKILRALENLFYPNWEGQFLISDLFLSTKIQDSKPWRNLSLGYVMRISNAKNEREKNELELVEMALDMSEYYAHLGSLASGLVKF